jgi:type VI secretion system secreted protein VgrG
MYSQQRRRNLFITSAAIPELLEGIPSLDVVKIQGSESLDFGKNSIFEYTVLLKTPAELSYISASELLARFDLAAMLGKQATLHIALDGLNANGSLNHTREITGIITQAQFKRVAERALHFEIVIKDWLSLGELNQDYAVYQNQSVTQTLHDVLNATYPYMFDIRTSHTYPIRDYCVRMGESASHFIKRLCQEYGINLHYEHRKGSAYLIFTDENKFECFPSRAYHAIRYHGDSSFINEEHWHTFSPSRSLTTGQVTYRDHNYLAPNASNEVSSSKPARTKADQQVNHANLEQYHYHSDAFGNTVQPDAGTHENNDPLAQGQVFTLDHLESLRQYDDRATAAGNIRAAVVGCSFTLTHHPMASANTEYIIVSATLLAEEIASETQRSDDAQQWTIETSVTLQPAGIPLKPARTIAKPRVHGVEVGRVVGYKDKAIWTDDLGRIRVAMPWHRGDPRNETSTCWVRVASNAAGNQQGSIHLPRIDDEILISYLGGDPDLPVCTGVVYNATHLPPWELPKNQALSGYRSREMKPGNDSAGRSNHLILDDSADAIQAQLKSDESHSSISLGHITRVEDNSGRKDKRGVGFELRTDGHGAIRAGQGLLITTQGRSAAQMHITDIDEAAFTLDTAYQQHKNLAKSAVEHQANDAGVDQQMVGAAIQTQNQKITGQADGLALKRIEGSKEKFPEFTDPQLLLHSPTGIELATPQSSHIATGEHIALTSGQHISMSIGKSLLATARDAVRLFAQLLGIKIIAAKGKIEIQAQTDAIEVMALNKIHVHSNDDWVEITAKKGILINGGTSYIKITSDGIEHGTLGKWVSHAAGHSMTGPKNMPLPSNNPTFNDEMFVLRDQNGEPVKHFRYKITTASGEVLYGKTNDKGETNRLFTGAKVDNLTIRPDDRHVQEASEDDETDV